MANLTVTITGIVEGDDYILPLLVTDLQSGDFVVEAYMTMKADIDDADPGLFQKIITTSDVPGTGQIVNSGAGDVDVELRFDLTPDDTILVDPLATPPAEWDVQIHTNDGYTNTPYKGTFSTEQGVTDATI